MSDSLKAFLDIFKPQTLKDEYQFPVEPFNLVIATASHLHAYEVTKSACLEIFKQLKNNEIWWITIQGDWFNKFQVTEVYTTPITTNNFARSQNGDKSLYPNSHNLGSQQKGTLDQNLETQKSPKDSHQPIAEKTFAKSEIPVPRMFVPHGTSHARST